VSFMDKKLLLEYSFATHQIMEAAKKGTLLGQFIKECSVVLCDFLKCDALNLSLKDKNKEQLLISNFSENQYSFVSSPPFKVKSTDYIFNTSEIDIKGLEELVFLSSLDKPSTHKIDESNLYVDGEKLTVFLKKEELRFIFRSEVSFKSVLILPIFYSRKTLGVSTVLFKEKRSINENKLIFFQILLQTLGTSMAHRYSEERQRERVKELSCVYKIAKLATEADRNIDEILNEAVQVIPKGFFFPKLAACQIVFKQKSYLSVNYTFPIHRISADIHFKKKKVGYIDVIYTKKLLPPDDYPFLKEEKHLIQAVAGELSSIIEKKILEEERITLQSQLLHTDRLAKIGQLTAGVAHELNEPLACILGFTQLITKEENLPLGVIKDLDKIINASLHAREIVKKLLLFSRQTPPEKKEVNFNEVIKEGLFLLESRIKKSNIVLEYHFASHLPRIILDPSQFNQILVNLVVNAIQAMSDKGRLTIKTEKCDKGVQLIIEDDGIGMTESDKDQAFIPFFTTKDINEGTGLGLSVVHGIVESHLGKIKLQSKKGVGTRLEIFFPNIKH
jgi:signal transduction histidine kinase